jgi:hypothetical protein
MRIVSQESLHNLNQNEKYFSPNDFPKTAENAVF